MPKRHYLWAIGCYLLIPVTLLAGAVVFNLIDPEMARGHGNYERDYRLLEMLRMGTLMASGGLAFMLWLAACYLVLESRQRSLGWLVLASAGPLGFGIIAMLEDRAPADDDCYQQFIRRLKPYWRVAMEVALFVSIWPLAFTLMLLKRELMIHYQSLTTGTPVATIVDIQNASSGMYAFGEGLEVMYLVVLLYLLWPICFNFAGRLFKLRP